MKPQVDKSFVYRARDVFCSGIGLVGLGPLFVAVAIAVRLDSRGPVFFRQERVGQGGATFRIHKFRSMHVDRSGLEVSTATDDRITRAGRFLRLTKIDELPQLIDVLVGDMSLVGPRPEVPVYVAKWPNALRPVILSVRPGITDPASVLLRHEAEVLAASEDPEKTYVTEVLPLKAAMYAEYVENKAFLKDFRILIDTVRAVVSPPKIDSEALGNSLHQRPE